jgi:transposase InsO family protein
MGEERALARARFGQRPQKGKPRFLNPAYLAAKSCAPKPPKTYPRLVTEIRRLRTTDLVLFNRKLADWLVFYNAERPHHSLSQQSPLLFLPQHQYECQRYSRKLELDFGRNVTERVKVFVALQERLV